MNQYLLYSLALIGGIFLAIQASLNASLGQLLQRPILATVAQSASGIVFSLAIAAFSVEKLPNVSIIKQVPTYLWFTGGLFSVLGVSLYYFTIPKLGLSTMISLGLSGQLIFALIAGHYGWLNMPTEPLTFKRLIGIICMITGILLIKLK